MRARRLALPLLLVALGTACGGAEGNDGAGAIPGTGAVSQERADDAMTALCDLAGRRVGRSEVRQAFFTRAHETIHEVAAAAEAIDPAAAGRLLQAKFAVEGVLQDPGSPGHLARLARELAAALAAALGVIGLQAQACPA